MSKVKRVYVEKKKPYAVKAKELTEDIKGYLGIDGLKEVRELVRYDVEILQKILIRKLLHVYFQNHRLMMFMKKHFLMMKLNQRFSA